MILKSSDIFIEIFIVVIIYCRFILLLKTLVANGQKSNDKIYGVLPYIAPEVLYEKPYTVSSDIYSFGIIMTELSSGKPPFYKRKHDSGLVLAISNGLRPEFGRTPEIYKRL